MCPMARERVAWTLREMRSVLLFRVAGVGIRVDWTWLIAAALFGWLLGTSALPAQSPHLRGATYAAMAVVATLLFFASILLHELGHAVQARREGVRTDDVTLWVFGGVARMRDDFPSPLAELRIAVAGPVVTLALVGVYLAAAVVLGSSSPAGGVAAWLSYINAVLLVFNLAPAFPLDGGRVLRALLWRRRGDQLSATRTAAAAGRAFAYVLIGLGVVSVLTIDVIGGIWLVVLGWFLTAAASAEERHTLLASSLGGLHVRDLMVARPVFVEAGWTLEELFASIGAGPRYHAYPVVEDDQVVGLLALDVALRAPRDSWPRRLVRDEMLAAANAPSVEDDELVADALAAPAVQRLGRALVRHGVRVVGLLSVTDVARRMRGAPH